MRVTVLCGSLAHNGIARPWILTQLLARRFEVQAIGRLRSHEAVWPAFADHPWTVVRDDGTASAVARIEREVTGDVVVAYGMGLLSFGAALVAKTRRRVPVVLDMPEWEVYEHFDRPPGVRRALHVGRRLAGGGWSDPHSFKYRWALDQLTGLADARTVCCEFLRERYGGTLLPQGCDPAHFDPGRFDRAAVRRKWGLSPDARIVFFGGNPQRVKGLEQTVAAINALEGRVDCRLVIAGRDESHGLTGELVAAGRGRVIALGVQPFSLMPELLATADAVVLWHAPDQRSRGYIPCKMFEAMAMAVPVVSSAHCDVPAILDGCGWVVPAHDLAELQATIEHVLTHPDEARERGQRARARVIERYSWPVMERVLCGVVDELRPRAAAGLRATG